MRQDDMMSSKADGLTLLMTGNEAMARGALEAGIGLGAGYPGTPSSEILENLGLSDRHLGIYVEWSTNEKVAFETAYGASMTGRRALVTMKHEGGNVVLDSLSKMVYTDVKGGFLVISCDDPGALSSSNEQDNRFFGQFVDMPVLEPSTPQEGKDMITQGFEISERFRLPLLIRSVTRVSHGKSRVQLGQVRTLDRPVFFDRNDEVEDRWFCCAFNHLTKHRQHHERMRVFRETYIPSAPFNRIEGNPDAPWGVITTGIAHNYLQEAIRAGGLDDRIAVLKLGMPYPLDDGLCKAFIRDREKVLVLEESDPFLENQIRVLVQLAGLSADIQGQMTGALERPGEMTFERVYEALKKVFGAEAREKQETEAHRQAQALLKPRPLTMCPGCPHRATHMALARALKKLKIENPIIFGDIGCYELGHEPPFDDMDSIYNMGAGVGLANGVAHAGVASPILALIGDSTLLHAGLPAFANAVHNHGDMTMIVFDNSTIAMTGHQASINSNRTLMGEEAKGADLAGLLKATGASYVATTDAFNIKQTQKAIQRPSRRRALLR